MTEDGISYITGDKFYVEKFPYRSKNSMVLVL